MRRLPDSREFVNEDFDFRGKTLTGAKESSRVGSAAYKQPTACLGEALGQSMCKSIFPPEAKPAPWKWFAT